MLKIAVRFQERVHVVAHADGVIEFGRGPRREARRVTLTDPYVSRNQLQIEQTGPDFVRVLNLSSSVVVTVVGGETLNTEETRTLSAPFDLRFGQTEIHVEIEPDDPLSSESHPSLVARPTWKTESSTDEQASRDRDESDSSLHSIPLPVRGFDRASILRRRERSFDSMSQDDLLEWFEVLVSVQKSAAGSDAFYVEAADAIVELVGLDRGIVLLSEGNGWRTAADRGASDAMRSPLSTTVLQYVRDQKRTFYENPANLEDAVSLFNVDAVVASPILSRNNEVLGVLYGVRRSDELPNRREISELEAKFVQLLAASVGTGLARAEHEADAARVRVQFEAFFSEKLVSRLQADGDLLRPQQRELTLLFCDVRGFTQLSGALDPQTLYQLMSDLMQELSECVMQQDGVIIDFYGDGLAAMWNAPGVQSEHAVLAATAARQMQAALPVLNERWRDRLGREVQMGIGIHTGSALVGNVGSQRRMKYGPRGNAVNLCSRLEGLTKSLGVPVLVSEVTASVLQRERWPVRRLGLFSLVGVEQPVHVFEVGDRSRDAHEFPMSTTYSEALSLFEAGNLQQAHQLLSDLPHAASDGPLHFLKSVIADRLATPTEEHSPVIQIEHK